MIGTVRKREISIEVHDALKRLETGQLTLDGVIAVVDAIEVRTPGDDHQKRFYAAVRELARKVAEAIK